MSINIIRAVLTKDEAAALHELTENPSSAFSFHEDGFSILHHAAGLGMETLVGALIEYGVDVNSVDKEGYEKTPIFFAVENNHNSTCAILISHGANVNAKESSYGSSPLHLASSLGFIEVAQTLIRAGADPNAADRDHGSTPLHLAYELGKDKMVNLLLASGASNEILDSSGMTPLARKAMSFRE